MEDKKTEEVQETVEKKPNKLVKFIVDHKTNIRDFAIGVGATVGLIALARLGSESYDSDDDEPQAIEAAPAVPGLLPESAE